MACDAEVSPEVTSHVGVLHRGFLLFLAAAMRWFAVSMSQAPNVRAAVG